MAGGDEGVIGRLDLCVRRQDRRADQPPPEGPPQLALEIVTGLDADRRRIEPDEQQPIAQRRQVSEGLDVPAVDLNRGQMPTRTGSFDLDLDPARRIAVHPDRV
ncbi:MAG TPA: hypothetical protein VK697_02565 [Methylomirabilota bacterium]|nr:hypothetical protein [Methylomirabilota bacterium]